MTFKLLDLFSGIGGFSLGLEASGAFETQAFCEIDPYCRAVLKKHWPDVLCYDDVRTLTADALRRDGIAVDAICGGFPCQDISGAGRKAGIDGERSGLWIEFARLIRELRPAYVIVENVADLLVRGIGRVLGDLATLGYDAEWHAIPASAVGAPHERDRLWIIAYPNKRERQNGSTSSLRRRFARPEESERIGTIADAASLGCGARRAGRFDPSPTREQDDKFTSAAHSAALLRPALIRQQKDRALSQHWTTDWQRFAEKLCGVDDGVSGRIHGLGALGNAVVPQIPEIIGRAIKAAQECRP